MASDVQTTKNESVKPATDSFYIVGIGASAGGLNAFKEILQTIPENSGMAFVLVQHLSPDRESYLPELLQKVTSIPVLEIPDTIKIAPNHIYVIPHNKMLIARDGILKLMPRPRKRSKSGDLVINRFFTSLAEVNQYHAVGIILSGNADDGTKGLKAIKDNGGITFAQDEATADYKGMPLSAAQAGVVDYVLSPDRIIPELLALVNERKLPHEETEVAFFPSDEEIFKQILSLLRIRRGTDFTYYKQTTIRRRILRRMGLKKMEKVSDYLSFLRQNKAEQDDLYQDLLIPVTGFFRDTHVFQELCESVFPIIVNNKTNEDPIRIWIAGCSTGEEAYSIAICFKEYLGDKQERVQIFATDVSEVAITRARAGIYDKNAIARISPQRLQEFFLSYNGQFQVKKTVRDMCIFAVHNFLKDPPFGKMDFISCRNVLIYMEPYLQKKALLTFHYALNPKGFLLLGKSETVSSVANLYSVQEKNKKLYTRKENPGGFNVASARRINQEPIWHEETNLKGEIANMDFQKTADHIVLQRYSPVGVIVNEDLDIVQFRGSTGTYLEQSPGKPTHNLLKMAKKGLSFELRTLLHKAKSSRITVSKEEIHLHSNEREFFITIEVIPLNNIVEPHYLVLFHKQKVISKIIKRHAKGSLREEENHYLLRIKQLEQELSDAREDMRSITEDQEASNEELQSANEELLSGSEELQSLNEELETSKEELQSTNEELLVVNQELTGSNEQLTEARDYAEAIIATIRAPLLVLNKRLYIQSANDSFYKTFGTTPLLTEGKLIYEVNEERWNVPNLRLLLENVLPEKEKLTDFEVCLGDNNSAKRVILLNGREIKRGDGKDKLILLSLEDITERKFAEEIVSQNNKKFRQLVKDLPVAVYSCDADGRITFFNDFAAELLDETPEIGKDEWSDYWKIYSTDGLPLSVEDCPLSVALKKGKTIIGEEIIIERKDGQRFTVLAYSQPEFNAFGEIIGTTNTLSDITKIKMAEQAIREREEYFRMLADLMPEKVNTADKSGSINYCNQNWLKYTGKTAEALNGQGWKKVIYPDDLKKTNQRWQQAVKTGNSFEQEIRFLCQDGTYKWHLSRAVAIKDSLGNIKLWIGTNTEIQKIKDEEQQKSDFLKMVSHELKTPITSIKGYAQLLLMMLQEGKDVTLDLSTLRTSLVRIDKQVEQLTRLISEILDISRIEESKFFLQKEKFPLNELVEETVQDMQLCSPNHTIDIIVEAYGAVFVDKDRIRQVIINFINNAIKYSPGKRNIEVRVHKIDKNKIGVSVKDHGIGIAPGEQKRIFERFYQTKGNDTKGYSGFGIGLYIVNEIIQKHNGAVTVESEKDKGSVFSFILPCTFEKRPKK